MPKDGSGATLGTRGPREVNSFENLTKQDEVDLSCAPATEKITSQQDAEIEARSFVCEDESSLQILQSGELKTIPVKIYSVNCRALLDTGAKKNYISLELFRKLRPTIENGCIFEDKIFINFTIGNITFKETFNILHNTPSFHLFLGERFFFNNRIIFDVFNEKLVHHGTTGTFWEIYFQGNECRTVIHELGCFLDEDFSQGKTCMKLRIKDDSIDLRQGEFLCEPLGEGFSFVPGIVGEQRFKVRMFPTVKDTDLKKGHKVGVLRSVLPVTECKENCIEHCAAFLDVKSGDVADLDLDKDEFDKVDSIPSQWSYEEFQKEVDCTHITNKDDEKQLRELLWKRSGLFTRNEELKQAASLTKFKIELLPGITPIYQKPRHFNPVMTEAIHQEVERLIEGGIIEKSKSAWNSPLVPIVKSDSTLRLAVDYRKVNKVSRGDTFPIPNLQDTIYNLQGMKIFSNVDLCRAYYQMEVEEESRDITSFSVPGLGSFRFRRLSFGLKTAPACFQREMEEVLREFINNKLYEEDTKNSSGTRRSLKSKLKEPPPVHVYLDDIMILNRDFPTHLDLLDKVLNRLEEKGLKAKLKKCFWAKPEIQYLGHTISEKGLKKNKPYFDKINKFDIENLKTIKELHTFLGLTLWQRKFMKNAAVIAKPLTELISLPRKTAIDWTQPNLRKSFFELKQLALIDNTLAFPDYSSAHKLIVSTDASSEGAGAELLQFQHDDDGELVPKTIALASMAFSKAQKNYGTMEKELAAIRWALKTFKHFLLGIPFILRTDHQPLKYLLSMRNVNSRLARTLTDLQEFDFEIQYIPGKENFIADGLSRNVVNSEILVEEGFDGDYFLVYSPPGGPNCLVECLLTQVGKVKELMKIWKSLTVSSNVSTREKSLIELRTLLVEELLKSPKKYKIESKINLIKSMVDPDIAPTFDILNSFSKLFNCVVYVLIQGTFLMEFKHTRNLPESAPPLPVLSHFLSLY